MRIGVDYTAGIWQGAGIGRYTRELIRAAVQAGPDLDFQLFYAAGGLDAQSPFTRYAHNLAATYRNITLRPLPISPRLLTILWQRCACRYGLSGLLAHWISCTHPISFCPQRKRAHCSQSTT